jgi:multicomponent Na+:H+ antiporter subunit F
MSTFLLAMATMVAVIMTLSFYRVITGPSILDRIIAGAAIAANGVVLLVLAGFIFDRVDMFIDIAIAYSLINLVWPMAFGMFHERRNGS